MAPLGLLAKLGAHGARLELRGSRVRVLGVRPEALPPELLEAARAQREELAAYLRERETRISCSGCGRAMQWHPAEMCFACFFGLDRSDFPTKYMPVAFELAATRGPAGRRGARVEEIRAIARDRRGGSTGT